MWYMFIQEFKIEIRSFLSIFVDFHKLTAFSLTFSLMLTHFLFLSDFSPTRNRHLKLWSTQDIFYTEKDPNRPTQFVYNPTWSTLVLLLVVASPPCCWLLLSFIVGLLLLASPNLVLKIGCKFIYHITVYRGLCKVATSGEIPVDSAKWQHLRQSSITLHISNTQVFSHLYFLSILNVV